MQKQEQQHRTEHVAAAGIEPYGGALNFIADNNTLHELRYGTVKLDATMGLINHGHPITLPCTATINTLIAG